MKYIIVTIALFFSISSLLSQDNESWFIPAQVDFSEKISEWDGFGFNYVEAPQHRDLLENPQDYGGFSLLKEKQKKEIAEMVFGEDGLQVQLVKMFFDPFHQKSPNAEFDHETTTGYMRDFVKRGLQITEQRNDSIDIITTLYGPPAWATKQKFVGARDIDPSQADNLGDYMVDWVKYLKQENFPVKYLSIHNEGEDFYRWDYEKGTQRLKGFDYNMYWTPDLVNQFLKMLPGKLAANGLSSVGVTNGEPSNWHRFYYWGYAHGLYEDDEALNNLGLLTSHGFINGDFKRLPYSTANNLTTDLLRKKNPDLHCWITSFSWGKSGTEFIKTAHEQIYSAKVNGLIPWAGIQHPDSWIEGDPNPGTAFIVRGENEYEITPWYYFYKQLTRAGYRGMSVVKALIANPVSFIIGFGSNGTEHPDAFVVTSNVYIWGAPFKIEIKGTDAKKFQAYRTSEDGTEKFKDIGVYEVKDGAIVYDPPKGTTTTFLAVE